MIDRDELLHKLAEINMKCRMPISTDAKSMTDAIKFTDEIADFIISDRKRIMWPIVIAYWKHPNDIKALWEGIDKSIILAGITGQAKSPNAD